MGLPPPTADEISDEKRLLRRENDAHVEFIDRLYAQITALQEQCEKLQEELTSTRQSTADEVAAREAAEQRVREMEQKLRDEQAAMEKNMKEMEEASGAAMEKLRQEMADLQAKFDATVADLEAKNAALTAEVAALKQELADKIAEFEKTLAAKDAEIHDLMCKVKGAEATVQGVLFMRRNVDAFHLATTVIEEPVAACMLPDGCTLVADTLAGLLMFSPHSELIQQLTSNEWKWPQGLVYNAADKEILVTLMRQYEDKGFRRVIMHFKLVPDSMNLYMNIKEAEHVLGPADAELNTHVAKEKLALAANGDLYLTVADQLGSCLYQLASGEKEWETLSKRQGQQFMDLAVLGHFSSITELLIVESKMGYLHKFAIRGKDIAARQTLCVVEKPACISVDEKGTLFVQDIVSGKVHQVNAHMEVIRDVCLIDDSVFSITASHGYLGVALRKEKTVKIYRYADTFIDAVGYTGKSD